MDTMSQTQEGTPITEGPDSGHSPSLGLSAHGDMGRVVYERKIKDQEARILARAIREGWNVPPEKKPGVVARLIRIVEDGIDRDAVSAAKALVAMDAADVDATREKGQSTYIDLRTIVLNSSLPPSPTITSPTPLVDKG